MLDYAPEFAKLHRWGADLFGRPNPENIVTMSTQQIHTYMMYGWETGLLNEFYILLRWGVSREQMMELVMFSQLYAGMRGLGHVYRAIGDVLPIMKAPQMTPPFPAGWEADPDAFKCGLDLSTREMTEHDRKNLTEWYEKTIGFVPNSILFGLKHHPEFVKVNRAKWEVAIKTLPKQVAPYMLLRHHTITGSREGLREAALLCKAWDVTSERIMLGVVNTAMYFTGFEGLYTAHEAIDDLL
jgi:hypothetical protein